MDNTIDTSQVIKQQLSKLKVGNVFMFTYQRAVHTNKVTKSQNGFLGTYFEKTEEKTWESENEMTENINKLVEGLDIDIINIESINRYTYGVWWWVEEPRDENGSLIKYHIPQTVGYKVFCKVK